VRAYATNSVGTGYGNAMSFSTQKEQVPVLTTTDVIDITSTTATCGGNISSASGAVLVRGVCWSISQNPTIANNKTTNGTGIGNFASSITGLTPGATYYIRAYATNSIGIAYGNQLTTTTTAILPVISTTTASAITTTTIISGGNISNDSGAAVTARGVCWSTFQNPIIANNKTTDGSGTGSFTSFITGLTPGTTYYIRAFATNIIGTAYGNMITTTTTAILPVITTTTVSAITTTATTSGGNVTNDGGAVVIARGICWSISQNPTIGNNKTTDGIGTGSFVSSITGLTPGTTYYLRAFATNIIGTAYGNQISFISGVPAIGQSFQGGVMAYILQSGDPGYLAGQTHGLIAAPSDQSTGITWGVSRPPIAIGSAVGTGLANTVAIITNQGAGIYAARLCFDLVLGGYSDWYLPSKDELNKLYLNKIAIGHFADNYYWSSTESGSYVALTLQFANGSIKWEEYKYMPNYVRAIRAF
jgi:hypothetical protein